MQVPKFRDFIKEARQQDETDPITVVVISKSSPKVRRQKTGNKKSKKEITVSFVQKSCAKRKIPCYIINTKFSIITDKDEEKNTLTIYNYDGEDGEQTFIGKNTVVITRAGAIEDEAGLSLISAFQNSGAFMLNTRSAMLTCDNKLTSALLFEKFNIPTPKTAFISNEKNLDNALKLVGNKFPVIVKTLTGTQGIGVVKVDSYDSLVSVVQALFKHDAELLLQEYMPTDSDVRTFVVDNKIFACTRRVKKSGEFRSNVHRGAVAEPYKLSDEEIEIVLRTARASKAYLVGIDHITYKDKIYVLEANGSPGTGADYEGYHYEDYIDTPNTIGPIKGSQLVDNVIEYISNRKHWDRQSIVEVGYLETIELSTVGKVRAKLDTGNGAETCALHAEEVEVKDGKVTWKYNGKKHTSKLEGYHKIFRANTNDGEGEKRPVVKLDLTFNGFTYKDVSFGLDERKRSASDVLLNRDIIRKMNASVNPNREFVLSRRIKPIDKK
jgi:ribosomal protein S6--L-glutamate ligase